MPCQIQLPQSDRSLRVCHLPDPPNWPAPTQPIRSRVAFAAAHVVSDPLADRPHAVDWEATLAYRRVLWSYGLHVAEAMDTAQRGSDLDWETASELIRRSLEQASAMHGAIACGAGTDQLDPCADHSLEQIVHAYEEQCEWIEKFGGRIILMASRLLPRIAASPDDYRRVYGSVIRQAAQPVILHWLGAAFDASLGNYWGSREVDVATCVCLSIIDEHRSAVDGIKISLLDADHEIAMRRRLPPGVRMYTGDDFGFVDLIGGDGHDHSDALLGIFDAIAPVASSALQALDRNDNAAYERILRPTEALSRTIFETPTQNYKTGIVFLAWLNGYQHHFRMLGGKESARSAVHLARVFSQAADAGVLSDPELACQRMRLLLAQAGVY